MTAHARGTFEVKLVPQAAQEGDPVGRMTIDKQFRGDLQGTSIGQMLAVRTTTDNSAGYVALERFTGTMHGRKGTFALQHNGLMNRGAQDLRIAIVPDSGTEGFTGISGSLTPEIVDGKHRYDLAYFLPDGQ